MLTPSRLGTGATSISQLGDSVPVKSRYEFPEAAETNNLKFGGFTNQRNLFSQSSEAQHWKSGSLGQNQGVGRMAPFRGSGREWLPPPL